jgi:hypothetical protein
MHPTQSQNYDQMPIFPTSLLVASPHTKFSRSRPNCASLLTGLPLIWSLPVVGLGPNYGTYPWSMRTASYGHQRTCSTRSSPTPALQTRSFAHPPTGRGTPSLPGKTPPQYSLLTSTMATSSPSMPPKKVYTCSENKSISSTVGTAPHSSSVADATCSDYATSERCKAAKNALVCYRCGGAHDGRKHNYECTKKHSVLGKCDCKLKCLLCRGMDHHCRSQKCPKCGPGPSSIAKLPGSVRTDESGGQGRAQPASPHCQKQAKRGG